jgi:hypothetical protein
MVAADGGGIAVPHDDDHLEPGVGQFYPGSERQGPAVGGVEGVKIHIYRHAPGTADPGNQHDIIFLKAGPVNGPDQGPQDNAVAAPRAPDVGKFLVVPQIFINKFGRFSHFKLSAFSS